MKALQLKNPDLKWVEMENPFDETLERLSEGKIDYAVSDSTQINLAKNFYPNLATAFNLGARPVRHGHSHLGRTLSWLRRRTNSLNGSSRMVR